MAINRDKQVSGKNYSSGFEKKILTFEELAGKVNVLLSDKKKIVFTNGCFDVLHAGHVRYLNDARSLGDILIVGVNSDRSVRRLKGKERPINDLENRLTVLSALVMIDYLVVFEEDTPYNLIKHIKPAVLVKGGDWEVADIVGSDVVLAAGGEVKSLPFYAGNSSSLIIERLKELS